MWLKILIIASIALLFIIFILFLLTFIIHNRLFKHRHIPDPLVKTYTLEMLGLKQRPIEFKCGKDLLRGFIYSSDIKYKDKIVIFCHGMWSTHYSYLQDIGYLCNNGYEVMSFDYNGTNLSDGSSLKGLSQSLACVDSAINFVKSLDEFKNKKIYVVGHSWGGFAAINSCKYHNDISGIVALSPFISISGVLKGMIKKPGWILIPLFILVERIRVGKYAGANALKALKNFNGSVLIIQSKNDGMVSYKYNTHLLEKKLKKNNIRYYINDDRYHNPNYTKASVDMLNEYLLNIKKIDKNDIEEFKRNTDYLKMGELDPVVMDKILKAL